MHLKNFYSLGDVLRACANMEVSLGFLVAGFMLKLKARLNAE